MRTLSKDEAMNLYNMNKRHIRKLKEYFQSQMAELLRRDGLIKRSIDGQLTLPFPEEDENKTS